MACDSHPGKDPLLRINIDDIMSPSHILLTDVVDSLLFIQYDSKVIIQAIRNLYTQHYIFVNCSEGIIKYDRKGNFLCRIGYIGQGPDEYNKVFYWGMDDKKEIIYVYSNPDIFLTYDFNGNVINRTKFKSVPDFFMVNGIWPIDNDLYFINSVPLGLSASKPFYWIKTDEYGKLSDYKQDIKLNFSFDGVAGFGGVNNSFSDESIIYFNQFNDTVFKLNNEGEVPLCIWNKGRYQIKHELITDFDSFFSESAKAMKILYFFDSHNYFFIYWEITEDELAVRHFTVYDKQKKLLVDTDKPIINNITGGTLEGLNGYTEIEGRQYLEFLVEPYELKEQLRFSKNLQAKNFAKTIDSEANQIIVLARIKQ